MILDTDWIIENLIGKEVIPINNKTGEVWQPQKFLKIEINKNGIFAILNENFNIYLDMHNFDFQKTKLYKQNNIL